MTANNRIESIRRRVDALKKHAEELKQNATFIRELDVIGGSTSHTAHRLLTLFTQSPTGLIVKTENRFACNF